MGVEKYPETYGQDSTFSVFDYQVGIPSALCKHLRKRKIGGCLARIQGKLHSCTRKFTWFWRFA
jgi:hypothetical protein